MSVCVCMRVGAYLKVLYFFEIITSVITERPLYVVDVRDMGPSWLKQQKNEYIFKKVSLLKLQFVGLQRIWRLFFFC